MEYHKLLFNKISQYGDITIEELEGIISNFNIVTLKPDEYLYKPQDDKKLVAFQLDGLIRSYILTEKGEERTIDFCRPGDILTTLDGTEPSSSWIEAIKETTLFTIENDKLEQIVASNNKLQIIILKMMESCLSLKSKREVELLSLDGKEKYKKFLLDNSDIINDIPQLYIASYLGISPVSLSRIKNSLN